MFLKSSAPSATHATNHAMVSYFCKRHQPRVMQSRERGAERRAAITQRSAGTLSRLRHQPQAM
eukprot:14262530-Heterocapsa_arctica.AAC.1